MALRWLLAGMLVSTSIALNFGYQRLTDNRNPLTLFYPGLIAAALLCGRAPAYGALLGAVLAISSMWLPPLGELYLLDAASCWALAGFLVVSTLMIEISVWAARSAQRLMEQKADLQSMLMRLHIDVAARRTAEEDLASQARLLRLATEAGGVGTWELDFVRDVNRLSAEAAMLLGVSEREFPAARWSAIVHPDDRERAAAAWAEAVACGTPYDIEYRSATPLADGTHRWFLVRGVVEREANEPRRALGVVVDITDRKRAEQALRESERRFRVLADGVPSAIWATDASGELEFVNAGYTRFIGLSLDEARAAQRQGWPDTIDPRDREHYVRAFRQAVADRQPFHAQTRVRPRAGGWHHVETHALPRLTREGVYVGHVGMTTDVTETVKAAEALQAADRRKDVFIATLSHELRNPLAPIRAAAQVLGHPKVSAEEAAWVRGVIQRQVRQIARLLDDLLDASRITQGKLTLRQEWARLAGIVETAVDAARPLLDRKRHRLSVMLPDDDMHVYADPVRLAQVLGNLLTNAAKYTDDGGDIAIKAEQVDGELRIAVTDNGLGIAPQALPDLFEMFNQGAEHLAQSEDGMGIGLALAQGLAHLHGGRISAHSDGLGRGSTFTLHLPLRAAPGVRPPAPPQRTPAAARRILVVDDNRDSADSLALMLRLEGHEVQVAYAGPEALAAARHAPPQVAFIDIGMPGMNGYQLAQALRAEPWPHRPTLIAMTGWGQDSDRRRAHEAGFDHHLTKPADMAQVLGALA